MALSSQVLERNVTLLKSKVTGLAVWGAIIAVLALVIATTLSGYYLHGDLSLENFIRAQKNNMVLWFLDGMPFIFAFWGQHVSSVMAYQAGAMVVDQTSELRMQAAVEEQKARHVTTHDFLTDLPNRILFCDRLTQALHSAHREKQMLAVLILDLDRFKEINDTLGHYNGDRLLKQVALRLNGMKRESDTLARLGGDEFGMLLPKIARVEDAVKVAQKVLKALEPPFTLEKLTLDVKASIGVTLFPDHGSDIDSLLQRADVAMYAAKNKQTGFMLYSSAMDEHSPYRLTLMGELRRAIEQEELVLNFQPKLDCRTNRVLAVESLVRWLHPKHGLLPPDEFIDLAERTGLIKDLTLWILKNSLRECANWQKDGLRIGVAVNLSAKNLLDPELPDIVTGLLASLDFPASYLTLEITETAIMTDPKLSLQILQRVNKYGVQISIDDFGTGYSSLAYLKKVPASELKIDKSFVDDMFQNENDEIIVRATIDLGHNLGLKVVAEGVEDQTLMDKVKDMGCDILQGYYISKPRPAEEFIAWLQQSPYAPANEIDA
jgi:diguanylate cyclase (GGDEF)-like protein